MNTSYSLLKLSITYRCWLTVSHKPEAAEMDPLLESQSDGGTLLGSSQMSAPEDYWFFSNRVIDVRISHCLVTRLKLEISLQKHVLA